MVKKLIVPTLAAIALLALPTNGVLANRGAPPPPGWRQVLSLGPGQTAASTTVRMQPADCTLLLKGHPDRTAADCVTHYSVKMSRSASPAARTDKMILAGYACGISVEGSMWNFNWWSDVTVSFCWSSTYVYAWRVDCSNAGVYPGENLVITWCGAGSSGQTGDGGDNVKVIPVVGGYYLAGQREWLDIYSNWGVYCWNAHC